jgi:pantetheine-phosphate adenylyltransferase
MKNTAFKTALFAGSFDPFTVGHKDIVVRALALFDKIIIGIGYNANKTDFFPVEKRIRWIEKTFDNMEAVEVRSYEGLTTDFAKEIGAQYLLRGIRTSADFEYERSIAQTNKQIAPELESVFLLTAPEYTPITSTIVRDIIRHGGDASQFLPYDINDETI